jgi:hypothetical protein
MSQPIGGMAEAWMWAAMEPAPTDAEKQLLDLFAAEYIVDDDHVAAARRCGFGDGFAADYGTKFIKRPYVLQRIQWLRSQDPKPAEERQEKAWQRRRNIAVLNEIAGNKWQKAAARVSAVREINAMYGFHAPTKSAVDVRHKGGVLIVPGIADVSEWEAAAAATQDALAVASRVD